MFSDGIADDRSPDTSAAGVVYVEVGGPTRLARRRQKRMRSIVRPADLGVLPGNATHSRLPIPMRQRALNITSRRARTGTLTPTTTGLTFTTEPEAPSDHDIHRTPPTSIGRWMFTYSPGSGANGFVEIAATEVGNPWANE